MRRTDAAFAGPRYARSHGFEATDVASFVGARQSRREVEIEVFERTRQCMTRSYGRVALSMGYSDCDMTGKRGSLTPCSHIARLFSAATLCQSERGRSVCLRTDRMYCRVASDLEASAMLTMRAWGKSFRGIDNARCLKEGGANVK